MCWLLPGSFDCFCCPHTSVHRPSIACLAVFLCGPGALFLHTLSGPSTICSFPPHGWSALDRAPAPVAQTAHLGCGDTPPPDAGCAGVALARSSDGVGWPSHPLYCRCPPRARFPIRSILIPCSRCSGCLSCLAVPLLLVCCARPCPSWCGSRILCVCVAPPPVCWRSWVPLSHTPSCPTCLPPVQGFHISVRRGLSRARLAGHGPVATPVAGTSRRAGRSPRPCGVCGHLVEGGGAGCLLMARSACTALGGCCSARTSWFPCVLLCVLLGLVSLPCVGRLCAQLLCCLRFSQFRPPPPLCDIPSGCCFFTGPWTVTRSSLRMLCRVAAFCRPLRPVLLLVLFPRSRSPVVGVLGLCWMLHGVPFVCQRRPVVGIVRLCWLLWGSFDCFCCPHTSVLRPSTTCLSVFPRA